MVTTSSAPAKRAIVQAMRALSPLTSALDGGLHEGLAPLGIPMEAAARGAVNLHLFVLGTALILGVLAAVAQQYRSAGRD